jgi:hypothetical protein
MGLAIIHAKDGMRADHYAHAASDALIREKLKAYNIS